MAVQREQTTPDYGISAPRFGLTRRQVRNIVFALVSLVLVLFVLFDLGVGLEHRSILWPWIDTVQANGYSERSFQMIRVGMTRQQVDALMCKPLGIATIDADFSRMIDLPAGASPDLGEVRYSYTMDGRCPWGNFAWFAREVYFQDGVVTQVLTPVYHD